MVYYRSFRNYDPPGHVEIWNESFTGRGAVQLRHCSPLERYAFCKPYFDPEGLVIAFDDATPIGFVHAGFGANVEENALSTSTGVISLIGVRPSHRRRGIGSELIRRGESYLTGRGAATLFAGQMHPINPFYFGLYGGSDSPGFLASDAAAGPFLEFHGYRPHKTCFVYQRNLTQALNVVDGRFPVLRRRYELRVIPQMGQGSWWQECSLGIQDMLEIRLEDTESGCSVGKVEIWEMEGFKWRWGIPAVGILNLVIQESLRRRGLGKFLLTSLLRYLQEQFFGMVEVQIMERNEAATNMFLGIGFEQVDTGRVYKKAIS